MYGQLTPILRHFLQNQITFPCHKFTPFLYYKNPENIQQLTNSISTMSPVLRSNSGPAVACKPGLQCARLMV
ncbi:hypothetical protein Hanom_Chr06g00537741 [Helianthus anomalus]